MSTLLAVLAGALVLELLVLAAAAGVWRWGGAAAFGMTFRSWLCERLAPWAHLARYRASLRIHAGQKVAGYVDRHSIAGGEDFHLMLSALDPRATLHGRVEVFRIGRAGDRDRELVAQSGEIVVRHQPAGWSSPNTGAAWHPSAHGLSTEGWVSGYHTIDFVARDGYREHDVAFLVVRPRHAQGDILVKLSTNTYQAYNHWGGSSLYGSAYPGIEAATVVSFDRPTKSRFFRWEYFYVMWIEEFAERRGLTVHYATDYDLHAFPEIADAYALVVSAGHDEYWSGEELELFRRRIFDQGKNVLFLGGNMAYWRIRYADLTPGAKVDRAGRLMVCYKNTLMHESDGTNYCDPATLVPGAAEGRTGLFRGRVGSPEIAVLGVHWSGAASDDNDSDRHDANKVEYRVKTALPWMVRDTGLCEGMAIGPVVGYEWDNTGDVPTPGAVAAGADVHRMPPAGGATVVVVFEADPIDRTGRRSRAEAVFFESACGAKVFSAGSIRWVLGLGKPGFDNPQFRKLNENLHEYFLLR